VTKITLHSWREFCKEPPITTEEEQAYTAAAANITADDSMLNAFLDATSNLWNEFQKAMSATTQDWSNVAALADAGRRLKRATIEFAGEANDL
jgi:hypothetical protein